jgi:hypothetical protein
MSDVSFSGPLFDGRAIEELHRGVDDVRRKLADKGKELARQAFAGQIRDDHGRFLSSITETDTSRTYTTASGHKTYSLPVDVGSNEIAVTTELATYGPWLEGTGSRNESTRFKGYHGFRQAAQALDQQAEVLADEAIKPYVEGMNR